MDKETGTSDPQVHVAPAPPAAGVAARRDRHAMLPLVLFLLALAVRALFLVPARPATPPEQALLDAATPGLEAPDVPGAATGALRGIRTFAKPPFPPPGVIEGLAPLHDPALTAARTLGAVLGAVGAALLAWVGLRLGGRRAGAAAGGLLALSWLAVDHATTWGPGALLLLAVPGALAGLTAWTGRGTAAGAGATGAWAGLAAAAGGSTGAALLAGACVGAPSPAGRATRWGLAIATGAAALVLAAPSFLHSFPALPALSHGPDVRSPLGSTLRVLAGGIGLPALLLAGLGAYRVARRADRAGLAVVVATVASLLVTLLGVGAKPAALAAVAPGALLLAGLAVGPSRGARDLSLAPGLARLLGGLAIAFAAWGTAQGLAARRTPAPEERAAEWIRANVPNGAPILLEDRDVRLATARGLRDLTDLADQGRVPPTLPDEYAAGNKTFRPVPLPPPGAGGLEAALFYDPNLALFFPWIVLRDALPAEISPPELDKVQRVFHDYFRTAWEEAAAFPANGARGRGIVILHRPDSTSTIDREKLGVLNPVLAGDALKKVREESDLFTGWLREGGEALLSGAETVGSLGFLELAASRDSTNADLEYRLAQVYLLRGRIGDAKRAALRGLDLDPLNGGLHYNLGVALESEGDMDGAEIEYRAAVANMPEPSVAHARLGGVLFARGDVAGARAELDTVRRTAPGEEADRYLTGILGDP